MNALEETLERLYYDPKSPAAYGGAERLWAAARRAAPGAKKDDVYRWLAAQDAYTLHKPTKQKFTRRRTVVAAPNHQLQADLMDTRSRSRNNDGVNYLLTAVDAFSRRGWAVPVKFKSAERVAEALDTILRSNEFFSMQTDKGKEFYNATVADVLKKYGVKHFSTENETIKASMVERFNRTLRDKIHRYLTAKNTNRFIDVLPMLVDAYNDAEHSALGMAPNDVGPDNQSDLYFKLYEGDRSQNALTKTPLRVGDAVRMSKARGAFERGYTPNWTVELFKVCEVLTTERPVVYRVKDYAGDTIRGTFYRHELQKVKEPETYKVEKVIRSRRKAGGGKEYYVKWMGYPDSFNSWVDENDMTDA